MRLNDCYETNIQSKKNRPFRNVRHIETNEKRKLIEKIAENTICSVNYMCLK